MKSARRTERLSLHDQQIDFVRRQQEQRPSVLELKPFYLKLIKSAASSLLLPVSPLPLTIMSPIPFVLRWGIIGAGGISGTFVRDLVLDPVESRSVTDVAHAVVAVGSRSVEKANAFIKANCPDGASAQTAGLVDTKPTGFGSYAEVYGNSVSRLRDGVWELPDDAVVVTECRYHLCRNAAYMPCRTPHRASANVTVLTFFRSSKMRRTLLMPESMFS